jgi:hypothetical protein
MLSDSMLNQSSIVEKITSLICTFASHLLYGKWLSFSMQNSHIKISKNWKIKTKINSSPMR